MRSYPFITDLFTSVLCKSRGVQGRLFLCPKMGTEINSDELGTLLKDFVVPDRLEKKYPLVLLMPPVSYGKYTDTKGEWDQYRFVSFFLTSTYYSGTNQIMNPNPSTKTSMHTIPQDWHDMKRCATNFIYVLDKFTRKSGLINTGFRLDQERNKTITPVSEIGIDRASGVMMEFFGSVSIGCKLEDYDEEAVDTIQVPEEDNHPEHQM